MQFSKLLIILFIHMCGIVGFYGEPTEVLDTLLTGLHRLEYRGYDSAGVALITQAGEIFKAKATGKVAELEKKLDSGELPSFANVGMENQQKTMLILIFPLMAKLL
jgi:glucosamine 6-phosphate synthetase-like amidotransferase/phosphosugar isomerase protein